MKKTKMIFVVGIIIFGLLSQISIAQAAPSKPQADALGIIYPHSADFATWVIDDFKSWYSDTVGTTVTVTETFLDSSDAAARVVNWNGTNPEDDIIWGGGRFNFEMLRTGNFGQTDDLLHHYKVPEHDNFKEFIGGWNLWDNSDSATDPAWYAAAISGFGFIYNTEVLDAKGLDTPTVWNDLTDHQYFGDIVMADPSESGSTTASVIQMLMEKNDQTSASEITYDANVTEAWQFWGKVAGNIGEFTSSSSLVPTKVADGDFAIGITIDYFAWDKERAGNPVKFSYGGATTVSPDPAAIINNAPNLEPAKKFMDYITSTRGQVRVAKFRTPANFKATVPADSLAKSAFDSTGNLITANFPTIEPYSARLDGKVFSRARSMFTQWFVINHDKLTQAWDVAYDDPDALAVMLKLPSNFNGTLSGLRDYQYKDDTSKATVAADAAANFDEAYELAKPTGIPGFEVLLVLASIIPLVILRRRRK